MSKNGFRGGCEGNFTVQGTDGLWPYTHSQDSFYFFVNVSRIIAITVRLALAQSTASLYTSFFSLYITLFP